MRMDKPLKERTLYKKDRIQPIDPNQSLSNRNSIPPTKSTET